MGIAQRTCIGCRRSFKKGDVVRIVSGPSGLVIDYREKLPGRGAYICPDPKCIKTALLKDGFSRGLKTKTRQPSFDEFVRALLLYVTERLRSLIAMSAKAGRLKAGYSAVRDSLEKGRSEIILFAKDSSEGTMERLRSFMKDGERACPIPFTKDEIGALLGREETGVLSVEDGGFAKAISKELARLKTLLNPCE